MPGAGRVAGVRGVTPDISLEQARALIERAINKAEQLGLRGSVAVVGGSGVLVSASRMDASGAGGMARARSKAWIAATQQVPSAEHLRRMVTIAGPVAQGFVACSPEANFPGAGGMPVLDKPVRDPAARDETLVIGGIAASGAAVSPFYPAGTDPMDMIADGVPANPEDLVVHYALGVPYAGQHGDDEQRWRAAFGEWPGEPGGRARRPGHDRRAGRPGPARAPVGGHAGGPGHGGGGSGAASGSRWPSPITAGTRSSRTGCRTRPPPPWPWPRPWPRRPGRSSAPALSWPRSTRWAGRPARGARAVPGPGRSGGTPGRGGRPGGGRVWAWPGGIPVRAKRSPRRCWPPGAG